MRATFLKIPIFLIVSGVCTAQVRPNPANAEQRALVGAQALKPAYLELPADGTIWAVRVVRTGGIAGRTVDVTVTSKGSVTCPATTGNCARTITGAPLQAMNLLVLPTAIRDGASSISPLCRDCFTTRVTIKRREGEATKTYFAYWDDTTAAQAPPEFLRIAQAALAVPQ